MSLGTLTIDLAANLAGLESDLGRAQRLFDANARNFQRTVASTAKVTAGIATGLAVGMAALTKTQIDNADAVSKAAQITATSTEGLSKLQYAASLSDVAFEELTGGLVKFNKGIAEAQKGSGAQAKAFALLDISLTDSNGNLKTTEQLFGDVAQRFSEVKDGATKTAIATDLFGKSGANLIPLLNGGKKGLDETSAALERMGGVIDGDTAKAAERFNDNISALKTSLATMGLVVAKDVVGPLAELSDILADPDTQKGLASIASIMASITVGTAKGVGQLAKFANFLTGDVHDASDAAAEDVAYLEQQIKNFMSAAQELQFSPSFNSSDESDARKLEQLYENARLAAERLAVAKGKLDDKEFGGIRSAFEKWIADKGAEDLDKKAAAAAAQEEAEKRVLEIRKKANEEAARFKEGLNAELAAMRERATLGMNSTELQKIQYRALHGDLQKATEQTVALFEIEAKRIDLVAEQQKADEAAKKIAQDRQAIIESLMTDEERINYTYDEMIEKIKELGLTVEETGALIEKANKKRGEELKKGTDEINEITKNMFRDMQTGLGDAIYDGLNGRSSDILQVFQNMITKMVAQAVAADIMGAIFPKAAGGTGGSAGGVVDFVAGVAGLFGGGKAVGGPVTSGKFYEVGENNRPELFASGGRQYLIPGNSGRVGAVGGGSSNVIHINMSGIKDSREARQAAGAVSRAVAAGISRAQRYT